MKGDTYATRRYRYDAGGIVAAAAAAPAALVSGRVYRFVLGRDAGPAELDVTRDLPADPFARKVLGAGLRPITLEELLANIGGECPMQHSFVVGDGSQIPWTVQTKDVARALRILITRRVTASTQPDILVSTAPAPGDAAVFLQVISWDPVAGAYQFYDRRDGAWIWAGSSWDALAPDSRSLGPFDSHVNGALNMKELKAPWLHWHSQSARVEDDVLPPGDPFRAHPIWIDRSPANDLELQVVRPGIERWTASRLAARSATGRVVQFEELFRQVVDTTTVNIASSLTESAVLGAGARVALPITFFIDRDALLDTLQLAPDIDVPIVDGALYAATLKAFDVHLTDGTMRFPGDTHFAFAVPERALEDLLIVRELVTREIVSPKLMASILMVDFSNPVFSRRRARLADYAPAFAIPGDPAGFEAAFVGAVKASGKAVPGSPEAELLANVALADDEWRRMFERRIEALFAALAPRWSDPQGFAQIFRLAESRRRSFRGRKLAEFALTVPRSNASDDPFLELTAQGGVQLAT